MGLPVARPQLDEPGAVGERRRQAELEPLAVELRVESRRQRRRDVHDQHVAGVQEPRQLGEARVDERAVVASRDEERDVVAALAAGLRRLVGRGTLEEASDGHSTDTTDATRSRARYRPLGSEPSIRASRPGTLSSGRGSSEMSSPGKASW